MAQHLTWISADPLTNLTITGRIIGWHFRQESIFRCLGLISQQIFGEFLHLDPSMENPIRKEFFQDRIPVLHGEV